MGEQEGAMEAEKQEVGKVSEGRIGIVNSYSKRIFTYERTVS
jgi:hypothetical protein